MDSLNPHSQVVRELQSPAPQAPRSPAPSLLVIDTSTSYGQVVLCLGDDYHTQQIRGARHGEGVIDAIQACLANAGLSMAQLDAIALVNGPGSLTGIRLACALVQPLAWTHKLPVLALNSLVALGWDKLQYQDGALALDARMGHCYVTRFSRGNWQAAEIAARYISLAQLPSYLAIYLPNWYFVGQEDSLSLIQRMPQLAEAPPQLIQHSADTLAGYALAKWRAGVSIPVTALQPNYLAEWSPTQ